MNKPYASCMNPGLVSYIQNQDLDIDWLIEAGCHDGSDTQVFLSDQRFKHIFAFEPDPVAFEAAKTNLAGAFDRVTFKKIALMDISGSLKAIPLNGQFGTGSTIFTQATELTNSFLTIVAENVSCLDDEIPQLSGNGALWLDVEGTAHHVLRGGARVLAQVHIAQIELDMHTQSLNRLENYREILRVMTNAGFRLIAAPIQPGFFGDALFIKSENLKLNQKMKSCLLYYVFVALHSFIYPLLGKPK